MIVTLFLLVETLIHFCGDELSSGNAEKYSHDFQQEFKAKMTKKPKARLNMTEKLDKGKDQKEDQRGLIVTTGTPLWQRNGRKRHIQFKAGKMYVVDNMVHPDPRKGYICIDQDYEHVMHFCWMERDALGTKEDDLTPDPYDSIFKRITKCTTGRVYVLKIRSTNQNYFFWMQESVEDRDSEICAKVNYLLNFPPPWMRFPHIACNLEVPHLPSDEASLYISAEQSNFSNQPAASAVAHDIENGQALLKILESELPGHSQPFKKKFASTADGISARELSPTHHGISENVSPDKVGSLTDGTSLMTRFGDEISAFTNTLGWNGGLEEIMRNAGSIEISDDDGLLSNDTDPEYTAAEELNNRVFKQKYYSNTGLGQEKPDASRYRKPRHHSVNEFGAAHAMSYEDKLKWGITQGLSSNTRQQTNNEQMKRLQQMDAVQTDSTCASTGDTASTSQTIINLNERDNTNQLLEKWESATDRHFHFDNTCETRKNTPTEGNVIYKRASSMESSCSCERPSVQSSYSSLVGSEGELDVGTFPTSPNRNAIGDSTDTRGCTSRQNTYLGGCINNIPLLAFLASAKEPNFLLNNNERQPGNAWTEDDAESSYVSARPSVQFSDEIMSMVGNDGSLNVEVAVLTTTSYNVECKSTDNREYVSERAIHLNEPDNEEKSEENWMSATKPNLHVDHKTQSNQPQKKGSVIDERNVAGSNGNHDRACKSSAEPSFQSIPSLENWKSTKRHLYLTSNEHEPGDNTVASEENLHSTQAQISFHEKTSLVDNEGLTRELWVDANSTTQVSMGKESALAAAEKQKASRARATNAADNGAQLDSGNSSDLANVGSQYLSQLHFTCTAESLNKNTASSVNESSSPELQNQVFPRVMTLQTALVGEPWSETGDPSNTKEEEENTEVTHSPEILERQNSSKSLFMCTTESRHNYTCYDCEGPSQVLPEHVCPKTAALLSTMGTLIAGSKLGDSSNANNEEGKSEDGRAVEGTQARSEEQPSSSLQLNQGKTPVDGGLGKPPDLSQRVACASIGVGTMVMQSTSTRKSSAGCSAQEPVSSVTPTTANPNRSGFQGVDVGCGIRSGNRLPPLKQENNLAQPGCSKLWNPIPSESVAIYEKARKSIISTSSSEMSTLSGYSQESEDDPDASKETADFSNPESSKFGDKEGACTDNRDTVSKNTGSSVCELFDQSYDTIQDEKSRTNTIAMVVLSASCKNVNAVAKQANESSASSIHGLPLGSAEIDGNEQGNVENTPGGTKNTLNTTGVTSASSRQGLQSRESAKPNHNLTGQKASNRTVPAPKSCVSKKTDASNLPIRKSLEEVIYVSGPRTEVKHNLRKRPQPGFDSFLSGPSYIINASPDGAGKRLRISSPGVPLPSPFRVPEASTVRSKGSRYPQTSGSTYLREPNQDGKRPNEDSDSPDIEKEAHAKKSRISNPDYSLSKSGPSRPAEGRSSPSGIYAPASRSSGSGSTQGRSLNRTSRVPIANNASKGSPQIAESSPRHNLRRRSEPAKTEDEQQTEPVRIREIKKTGPETRVRARTNPNAMPKVQRVDRSIRDQSQNTKPVLIDDKKGSKSKTTDQKP